VEAARALLALPTSLAGWRPAAGVVAAEEQRDQDLLTLPHCALDRARLAARLLSLFSEGLEEVALLAV